MHTSLEVVLLLAATWIRGHRRQAVAPTKKKPETAGFFPPKMVKKILTEVNYNAQTPIILPGRLLEVAQATSARQDLRLHLGQIPGGFMFSIGYVHRILSGFYRLLNTMAYGI